MSKEQSMHTKQNEFSYFLLPTSFNVGTKMNIIYFSLKFSFPMNFQ